MRCFFCKNLDEDFAVLDKTEERHLFKVLRAEAGKEILLIDGKGIIAHGMVENAGIRIVKKDICEIPRRKIHLFTALPRKHRMDTLLAQCTEAGMWALHPIITERSVVVPKKDNMSDKWKDKMIEACKQAHNPFVPEIYKPVRLIEALQYISEDIYLSSICSKNQVQNVNTENQDPEKLLHSREKGFTSYYGSTASSGSCSIDLGKSDSINIAWFVGPEGGFADNEIKQLKEAGAKPVSLGRWIMRIETAAVAGILSFV